MGRNFGPLLLRLPRLERHGYNLKFVASPNKIWNFICFQTFSESKAQQWCTYIHNPHVLSFVYMITVLIIIVFVESQPGCNSAGSTKESSSLPYPRNDTCKNPTTVSVIVVVVVVWEYLYINT